MMTPEEKRKLAEGALKQAEVHEEEMRLSYVIAQDRTRCLQEQLKQGSLDSGESLR
jgi:hypothetical protein